MPEDQSPNWFCRVTVYRNVRGMIVEYHETVQGNRPSDQPVFYGKARVVLAVGRPPDEVTFPIDVPEPKTMLDVPTTIAKCFEAYEDALHKQMALIKEQMAGPRIARPGMPG